MGGGNILPLDGNGDRIAVHICLNSSNYELITGAFIICKLYFKKVNRVDGGYHGSIHIPSFQLNLQVNTVVSHIPTSVGLLNIWNKFPRFKKNLNL